MIFFCRKTAASPVAPQALAGNEDAGHSGGPPRPGAAPEFRPRESQRGPETTPFAYVVRSQKVSDFVSGFPNGCTEWARITLWAIVCSAL